MDPKFLLAKPNFEVRYFSPEELKKLLFNNQIDGNDLVYAKYLEKWTKLKNAKGFRTIWAKLKEQQIKSPEIESIQKIGSSIILGADSEAISIEEIYLEEFPKPQESISTDAMLFVLEDKVPQIASQAQIEEMIENEEVNGDVLVFANYLKQWKKLKDVRRFKTILGNSSFNKKSNSPAGTREFDNKNEEIQDNQFKRQVPKKRTRIFESKIVVPKKPTSINFHKYLLAFNNPKLQIVIILVCFSISAMLFSSNFIFKKNRNRIMGNITFNGKPLEDGKIAFDSVDGSSNGSSGEIIDGKYDLKGEQGVEQGNMIVRIWGFRSTGNKINLTVLTPVTKSVNQYIDEIEMFIPEEFNTLSKKTVKIEKGKLNIFNFELNREME